MRLSGYTPTMSLRPPIRHCPDCGSAVEHRVPELDERLRAVCPACHAVHYQNPLNVVGMVLTWQGQVLLCKRNIEPRKGFWTLPAGFMELAETTAEGAARETREEAGAEPGDARLFAMLDVVPAGQVHFFYLGQALSAHLDPGEETQEAFWCPPDEIPWGELAFETVRRTLRHWMALGNPSGEAGGPTVPLLIDDIR